MKALFLCSASLATANVQAAAFSLVGGVNKGFTNVSGEILGNAVEIKSGFGYSAGLLAEFGSGTRFETGVLYVSTSVDSEIAGITFGATGEAYHIPALLRFGGKLSLGVGGFYLIEDSDGNYGPEASLRMMLSSHLFLDLRYAYSLKSTELALDEPQEVNPQVATALIGYRF